MEPFAHSVVGEAWLASVRLPGMFVSLMRLLGVSRQVSTAEISCYVPLLLGDDGGSAFLKIMCGFELTADKQLRYLSAVHNPPYPVQIVLGCARPSIVMAALRCAGPTGRGRQPPSLVARQALSAGGLSSGNRRGGPAASPIQGPSLIRFIPRRKPR